MADDETSRRRARLEAAVALHRAGRVREAERAYRDLLETSPDDPDALHLLGVLVGQSGRPHAAIQIIQRAIAIDGTRSRYHSNLGKYLLDAGSFDEAAAACRAAIALEPGHAGAHNNLAAALNAAARFREAEEACRDALRLEPTLAAALNNLGNAYRGQDRLDDSMDAYRQALALDPVSPEFHANLANVLKDTGRIGEAVSACREALRLAPDWPAAQHDLLNTIHYDPSFDADALHAEAHRWYVEHAAHLVERTAPHLNDRSPDRRLRIGYVSPDFREHPAGLNLLPLLREHDHRRVEVYCYSSLVRADSVTERFRALADAWRDVAPLSDAELAEAVRREGIDILVDLSLHAGTSRLGVFARKPAPVQATFAGYPGTTGVETIDYRMTDPQLDPPESGNGPYSEESVRLPDSFWCYDPMADDVPVNPLPAATCGFVTFGCLNSWCKVNDAVLRLWAAVMREATGSRLIVLSPPGAHRQRALDLFEQEGVSRERVSFVARRPRGEYLLTYHEIDVALDTVPYNGHTTSLDAFWMGVPTVTLVGRTVVGRAGLSQLTNLGLSRLVARTPEAFVAIAVGLARDGTALSALRSSLRQRMRESPLMDAPRFARAMESAYREMWRRWCGGEGRPHGAPLPG